MATGSFPENKKIVIVGCGYGGRQLAVNLIRLNANITIIDTKDSFHHNVAGVRTVVDESYARKMFLPYKPTFGDKFIQGTVEKIDPNSNSVSLKDGTTVQYDALVLSTGCVGPFKQTAPKREDSIALYSKYAKAVEASKSVLFIGGGAVGVEAACEVATDFPDKTVTVIHATNTLIGETAPAEFSKLVKEKLQILNVNVIYGEKANDLAKIENGVVGDYEVTTDTGRKVQADVIFKTTGLTVNKSAYATSLAAAVEANGTLKVNEFYQVEGHKNIFAIGDCAGAKHAKVAFMANEMADYLTENLPAFLEDKPMKPWDTGRIPYYMCLAMGRNHAVGAMPDGTILPEADMKALKCNDLLLGYFYKEMNQTLED